MAETFGKTFGYAIRRGEKIKADRLLTNERAAQLIMAVYLDESWSAVRKVVLFDQGYQRIFSRKVDAHKLFLLSLLDDAIDGKRADLRPDLASSFASVRFTLVGLLADVLRLNKRGRELLDEPEKWLPDTTQPVVEKLADLAGEVTDSFNFFVEEEQRQATDDGKRFDPKTVFKSRSGVRRAQQEVKKTAKRQQRREGSFLFDVAPQ